MAENLPPWSPASGGAFCPDWPQATRPRIPWLSSPSAIKICDSFLRRSSRTALLSRDEVANLLENVACISELRQPSGTRKPLRKRPLLSTIWLLGSSGRTGSGYIHAERAEEHPAPLPLAVEAASIWLRPAVRGGRAGCSDTGADLWGTEGSNPSLSSGESANLRSLSRQ